MVMEGVKDGEVDSVPARDRVDSGVAVRVENVEAEALGVLVALALVDAGAEIEALAHMVGSSEGLEREVEEK